MIIKYRNTNQLSLHFYEGNPKIYNIGELLVSFIELDFNRVNKLVDDSLNFSEPKNIKELKKYISSIKKVLDELSNLHDYFKNYSDVFYIQFKNNTENSSDLFERYTQIQEFLKKLSHDIYVDILTAEKYYEAVEFCFNNNKNELYRDLTAIQRYFIYVNCFIKIEPNAISQLHIPAPINSVEDLTSRLDNCSTPEEIFNIIKNIEMVMDESYYIDTIENACYIELQKILSKKITIKKCKNCDKFFINNSRADAVYCDRVIDKNGKTCKDVGATNQYREKNKDNTIKKEYNKSYKTHYARIKYGKLQQSEFLEWADNAKNMKDKALSDEITEMDFIEWLNNN